MAFTNVTDGSRVIQAMSMPMKLVLSDTCDVGDLIGCDTLTDFVWEKADANAKCYANFIAGEPCKASGDTITVYREAVVGGFSDAAVGDLVYLSDTPGTYAAAPVGDYQQVVGMCISDTEAILRPDAMPVMSYNAQTTPTGLGMAGFFRTEINDGTGAHHCGGIKVECKSLAGCDSLTTMYGISILMQCAVDTTGNQDMVFIRLETSGTYSPNAFIECVGNAAHFLSTLGITTNWAVPATAGSTVASGGGYLKVDHGHGTYTSYIPLYRAIT